MRYTYSGRKPPPLAEQFVKGAGPLLGAVSTVMQLQHHLDFKAAPHCGTDCWLASPTTGFPSLFVLVAAPKPREHTPQRPACIAQLELAASKLAYRHHDQRR